MNDDRRRRSWSLPLGRVLRIPIRLHLSIFLLVAWFGLASRAPGGPGLVAGMAWLAIIFGCVTVHELSHSVVARRRGYRVRGIVLLPIGGMSQIESARHDPRDELAVSAVGPAASLGIAVGAAVVAVAAGAALFPVDLVGGPLVSRVAWFNLLVAAFNLLPAFPLDGGRVLRSLLERRYDLEAATRLAARVGRGMAGAMVVFGIVANPWLALIGIFVWFGASSEETATVVRTRLEGRRVRDVMLEHPIVLDSGDTVDDLDRLARITAQRQFPVVAASAYAGLASLDDTGRAPGPTPVGEVAARHPTLRPDDPLDERAVPAFADSGAEALVVMDDGEVVGLLRADDLARLVRR